MNQTIARIIRCQECGTNNKIPHDKAGAAAKCGKCHAKLDPAAGSNGPAQHYTIRCLECKAKNSTAAQHQNNSECMMIELGRAIQILKLHKVLN